MHKRYDQYLVAKYAPLYRDRFADKRVTAMCWGFSVGSGWFNIINTLSRRLCLDWLKAKEEYDNMVNRLGELKYPSFKEAITNKVITQMMIDNAYLLLEEERKKVPVAVQVKEKFGGLIFSTGLVTERQDSYISFAQSMSKVTCEVCGAPGKIRSGSWLKCLCKTHANER
jgi:hypothetical protein